MNSKERVLAALCLKKPDRVPFMELHIDPVVGERITGKKEYTKGELAKCLNLDGIGLPLYPDIYVKKTLGSDGREYITDGLLKGFDDLKMIRLKDPKDNGLYDEISKFVETYGKSYALFVSTNIGLDPLLLGMGMEGFSYSLMDNLKLIENILDIYTEWTIEVVLHLQKVGIDIIWFTDDIAFNTSLMFSPEFFREIAVPRLKKVMDCVMIPTIYHSDGYILPLIDDLIELGFKAIHPIDPSALNINQIKEKYGSKVCLIGNIDLRHTLVTGTIEDVRKEVKERIENIGNNGGYIISSANSITEYCKIENVLAMRDAIFEYGTLI